MKNRFPNAKKTLKSGSSDGRHGRSVGRLRPPRYLYCFTFLLENRFAISFIPEKFFYVETSKTPQNSEKYLTICFIIHWAWLFLELSKTYYRIQHCFKWGKACPVANLPREWKTSFVLAFWKRFVYFLYLSKCWVYISYEKIARRRIDFPIKMQNIKGRVDSVPMPRETMPWSCCFVAEDKMGGAEMSTSYAS